MKILSTFICILACLSVQAREPKCSSKSTAPQFNQGDQSLPPNAGSGYPYPAKVNLKDGWNAFTTVSYLYWFAGQDGMDIATTDQFVSQVSGVVPNSFAPALGGEAPQSTTVYQKEQYNSGFKIGMGYNTPNDDWVFRVDYTRFHQSAESSHTASGGPSPAFQLTNWFYQVSGIRQTPACTNLSSEWTFDLDWLDIVLQRPFYAGRKLLLNPFMGLRTSWISQSLNIKLHGLLNVSPPTDVVHSRNWSHAWAVGPRFGIEGHFLLGLGLRLQGEVGGTVLYNKFTKVAHFEDPLAANTPPIEFESKNNDNVRTMSEASLGLGWGGYMYDQRYHVDLSATYEFNHLPEQNQMRVLNDIQIDGVNATAKSAFMHGLTVTATFTY